MTDDELRALLDRSMSVVDYGRAVENAAYERAAKVLAEVDMLNRNAAEVIRSLIVPRK